MSWIRVSLFGDVSWRTAAGAPLPLESARVQELFAYLLLHPRRVTREALAGVIWPELPAARARQYLRKTVWQLQSALQSTELPRAIALLDVSGEDLALTSRDGIALDTEEFVRGCAAARGLAGREMDPRVAEALRCAVSLHQGELLAGWYQEWCLVERERYQLMYIRALDRLAAYEEARGQHEAGIEHCLAVLVEDPAREYTHRALMRMLWASGDRTGALRQFERCRSTLRDELDVAPARETLALYERIRAGGEPDPRPGIRDPRLEISSAGDDAGTGIVAALRRLHGALEVAQHEVCREIEARTAARKH